MNRSLEISFFISAVVFTTINVVAGSSYWGGVSGIRRRNKFTTLVSMRNLVPCLILVLGILSTVAGNANELQSCKPVDLRRDVVTGYSKMQDGTRYCYTYSAAYLLSLHYKTNISGLALALRDRLKNSDPEHNWISPSASAYVRSFDLLGYGGYTEQILEDLDPQTLCLETEFSSQHAERQIQNLLDRTATMTRDGYLVTSKKLEDAIQRACQIKNFSKDFEVKTFPGKNATYTDLVPIINQLLDRGIPVEYLYSDQLINLRHSIVIVGRNKNCTFMVRDSMSEKDSYMYPTIISPNRSPSISWIE